MSILIDKVRIKNFRSLKDVEIDLQPITILVGANNAGKTTFLRALNAVLGTNRTALNSDDLFIDKDGNQPENEIIIDIRIVPIDENGKRVQGFISEDSGLFENGADNFALETLLNSESWEYYAFRSIFSFENNDKPEATYILIEQWQGEDGNVKLGATQISIPLLKKNIVLEFLDAQRDLNDDIKQRSSFFGKQTTEIRESVELKAFEGEIDELNKKIVNESAVLKELSTELSKLNQTIQNSNSGVSIKPLNSRIRDLHKGMKVEYQDNGSASFGMEYHGMGTRSWASILSFGAYVNQEFRKRETAYLPILALEEPEAHLHPNAQRTLYQQLKKFQGQKIVSTHSPYIAGQAELEELRHFYKKSDESEVGQISILSLDKKQLERLKNDIETSKGELLFSKIVVMCEGETEEILLPLLFKTFFGKADFELGVNFAKTGKYYSLLPLLHFLKIEWFIFSDYDKPDVKGDLKTVLRKNAIPENDARVIKLNDEITEKDIEEYLWDLGYSNEIKQSLKEVKEPIYANEQHRLAKQQDVQTENARIDGLSKEQFIKELDSWKTKTAPIYANLILNRAEVAERFPPKIKELFDKIADVLKINTKNHSKWRLIFPLLESIKTKNNETTTL